MIKVTLFDRFYIN